ncbi:EAL domain-containing protein [Marinomonas sp. M1K-6]|uniref:EAL domain-containing protein n=1 Tax=Marinomonas profundi TaxID=2726122 RepID=A0A847R6U4_9GAMM|nr:EAL domain-containing protein [Marinomonas profundi]NLQ16654.1 EAL domain-containing protein [Marinomonas profundi]UDV03767.1 EAL domain-containing protein [Marinomonas profundi]
MGMVFSKSLFIKQAVLTLALAVVLSLVSSAIQVVEGIRQHKAQINQDFTGLMAIVGKPLAEAVFRLDVDFAQQQVDSLLTSSAIARVEVRDDAGVLFVEATAAAGDFSISPSLAEYFLSDLPQYRRELRLETPEFQAGYLSIYPEKRVLLEAIFTEHLSILTYNLFKDVLLASLISLFFYFLVTHPLKRLTESLSTVGRHENLSLPGSFYRYHRSDELGNLHASFVQLWDKLKAALSDLERSNRHTRAMIEHAADGILLLDEDHRITLVNSAAESMLKMSASKIRSGSLAQLHTPSSWTAFSCVLHSLQQGSTKTVEAVYQVQNAELPVEIRLAKYQLQGKTEIILLVRDVLERKEAEAHIHYLAYYDAVTKLPNRQFLSDRLEEVVQRERHVLGYSAVVFMDVDHFKVINDSLGHNVGDQLLCSLADQLLSLIEVDNKVVFARMGGDEFAFLLESLGDDRTAVEKHIKRFAERVMSACQQVKKAGHHEVHITASLGGAIFSGHDAGQGFAETILKQADTALYRAKASGRNTFALYQSEMQAVSDARLEMEKALHHAIEDKQFALYYQPQNDANGQVIGAEALIRWKEGDKGFISPAVFIPVAEEIGLIVEIGQWVLNEALSQVAIWLKEGKWHASWRMSINVSPIQFQQAGFLPMLKAQLEQHDVPAGCIDLEITENTLLNDLSSCLEKMHAIKALGVHLSIDDFGTGYSSLKYLKSLPIDRLKIDQSFVRDLLVDGSDEAIVRAIIAMSKALNISVLAEGVETAAQYHRLWEMQCFHYQGYYFGHPLPADKFVSTFVYDALN